MIDEKGIRQERWKSWKMVWGGELENERQVKRGVLQLGVKNTWLTTPLVTQPAPHTQQREWMCSHSSKIGSAAEGNAERLMNVVFKYSKTFMQLSLFSFTLKYPLVQFPYNLDGSTWSFCWKDVFSFQLPDTSAEAAENWTSAWNESCANESAACDGWNFQHVPFNADRCPYSSNYCAPANLNDLNSAKRQISPVIERFLCRTKRIWHSGAWLESGGGSRDTWQWLINFLSCW